MKANKKVSEAECTSDVRAIHYKIKRKEDEHGFAATALISFWPLIQDL